MTSGTTALLRGVWGTSAASVFAVGVRGTILRYNGTHASVFSWPSVTGRVYAVQTATNLVAGWAAVPGWTNIAGTGGTLSYTNDQPDEERFYGIRVRRAL